MPKFSQYKIPSSNECIDFSMRIPNTKNLPLGFLKETFKEYSLELDDNNILQYNNISGFPKFKKSLAGWLNKKNYANHQVDEKELFIVNGITGGLQLILGQYLNTDDVILVEEPSYFLAINIFKEYGLTIDSIKMDEDGMNLESLEAKVRKYSAKQKSIFLYSIPTCHNPTGSTISDEKRKQLAAIATVYTNFYIIADEAYHFINWNEEKIQPMADYHCNFISLCSFSKILAPSLRVGWIYINNSFLERSDETTVIEDLESSALSKMNGGNNMLGSLIVDKAINSGFLDKHLDKLIEELKMKSSLIVDSLKKSGNFTFNTPLGGYFIWLKSKYDSEKVLSSAKLNKVNFNSGEKFSNHDNFKNNLQVNFNSYDISDIKDGIDRLNLTFSDYDKIKIALMGDGKMSQLIKQQINETYNKKYLVKTIIKRGDLDKDINNVLNTVDVIIDFSSKNGTIELINYLQKYNLNKPILSGTTGHDETSTQIMKNYSKIQKIMNINNFSKTLPVIKNLVEIVNKLPDSWKIKLVEKNKDNIEQISETTKIIKSAIINETDIEIINDDINSHDIICSDGNEIIKFSYQTINSNVFAKGCLDMIPELLENSSGFKSDIKIQNDMVDNSIYSANGNIISILEDYEGNKTEFISKTILKNTSIDGFIFISDLNTTYCSCNWEYYNKDGNKVNFCGNGIRCLMKYIYDNYKLKQLNLSYNNSNDSELFLVKYQDTKIMVQSPDHIEDDEFNHSIQSDLETECEKLGIEVIDMELHHVGVPHLIVELKEQVLNITEVLEVLGNILYEYYCETVDTDGININFVNLNSDSYDHSINVVTWERGVNKITESCGSGSLAAFYYYLNDNTIKNHNQIVNIHYYNGTFAQIIEEDYLVYLVGLVNDYDTIEVSNDENLFNVSY